VEKTQIDHIIKLNDYNLQENFGRFLEESSLDKGKRLQLTEKQEVTKQKKEEKEKVEATK